MNVSTYDNQEELDRLLRMCCEENSRKTSSIIDNNKRELSIAWQLHEIDNDKNSHIVYFIENESAKMVKIGKTSNLLQRIKQLQGCYLQIGMMPIELKCRAIIFCDSATKATEIEKKMHNIYRKRHSIGEWYQIDMENVLSNLDEYWSSPLYSNGIPIYCGLSDVSELQIPKVIEYDSKNFENYIKFAATHSGKEYHFAIQREYGIPCNMLFNVYDKYKNARLDDFILHKVNPITESLQTYLQTSFSKKEKYNLFQNQ